MTCALERGEGGHGIADEGCVNVTVAGGGVKKSDNFADIIYGRPLRAIVLSMQGRLIY